MTQKSQTPAPILPWPRHQQLATLGSVRRSCSEADVGKPLRDGESGPYGSGIVEGKLGDPLSAGGDNKERPTGHTLVVDLLDPDGVVIDSPRAKSHKQRDAEI